MIGTGGTALVSKLLGEGKQEEARPHLLHAGTLFGTLLGAVLSAVVGTDHAADGPFCWAHLTP